MDLGHVPRMCHNLVADAKALLLTVKPNTAVHVRVKTRRFRHRSRSTRRLRQEADLQEAKRRTAYWLCSIGRFKGALIARSGDTI